MASTTRTHGGATLTGFIRDSTLNRIGGDGLVFVAAVRPRARGLLLHTSPR